MGSRRHVYVNVRLPSGLRRTGTKSKGEKRSLLLLQGKSVNIKWRYGFVQGGGGHCLAILQREQNQLTIMLIGDTDHFKFGRVSAAHERIDNYTNVMLVLSKFTRSSVLSSFLASV